MTLVVNDNAVTRITRINNDADDGICIRICQGGQHLQRVGVPIRLLLTCVRGVARARIAAVVRSLLTIIRTRTELCGHRNRILGWIS